jgi:copine 1/2/3
LHGAGLVHAYKNSFNYVGLSGPTYLAPVIATAAQMSAADAAAERLKYTVLLLLTDGQANDLEAAVGAIVAASSTPLSIVIVGVGGADFSAMDFLDGDGQALTSGGRTAARDIVQFVPFRRFAAGGPLAGSQLAAATLAELPQQLVKYFTSRGIMPPPPLQAAAVPVPLPAPGVGAVPVPLATTALV